MEPSIGGAGESGKITPEERKGFEQEYRHGADLFQRALAGYSKTDNPYQKEEFKEVMDKALGVLNGTASQLLRKELMDQTKKISKDYSDYQDHPNGRIQKKLDQDLEAAKQAIDSQAKND